jgi:outer membrane biosynthesis protein TonB
MTPLPRFVADNPRMGSALLGSILFHAAVLILVSLQLNLLQTRKVPPSELNNPLLARLVAPTPTDTPESPPKAQLQAPVTSPVPDERPGAILSRPGPGLELPAAVPETRELPVPAEQQASSGEPGPPFGVRLAETLFLRPYPRRFTDSNPLLKEQGYVRDADLDERPKPITLALPDYPATMLARRIEGWVVVAFFLDEKGGVVHTAPVESTEEFQRQEPALIEALRKSTFTPGKVKGKPVKSITFQTLRFNPEGWGDRSARDDPAAPAARDAKPAGAPN